MLTQQQRREAVQNRQKAMSHAVRAEILRLLIERGTMSPVQLGRELREATENCSYHCKRLVKLDCAELVDTRPVRGATEHFYRATERSLVATDEWSGLHPTESHRIKAEIVQMTLDDFVSCEHNGLAALDSEFHMTRTPVKVDSQGLLEGLEILERARLEMADVERRSVERASDGGEATFPASSSLMFFRTPPIAERTSSA